MWKKIIKNEFSSTKDVGHVRLHEKFKLIINFNSRKSHDAICTEQSEASSKAKKALSILIIFWSAARRRLFGNE
jgi:hypothetical protein